MRARAGMMCKMTFARKIVCGDGYRYIYFRDEPCPTCDKKQVPQNQEFCSRKCFLESKRVRKQCEICDKEFFVLKCHKQRRTCGKKCAARLDLRDPKKWMKTQCANCDVDINVYIRRWRSTGNMFCGRSCQNAFIKKCNFYAVCDKCGKRFLTDSEQLQCKWCSNDCAPPDERGKIIKKNYRSGIYRTSAGEQVCFDSAWELERMKQLDITFSVESWRRSNFKIPYIDFNGVERVYNPDFEIVYRDGRCVVEEIKGIHDVNSKLKADAAYAFLATKGWEYRILFDHVSCVSSDVQVSTELYENDYGIMSRPTFEFIWMKLAVKLAERSTCLRNKVGAVFVTSDMMQTLCIGYNGDEVGGPNQCDSLEPGKCGCVHAEMNATSQAKTSLSGSILFVTVAPCHACAKLLISRGISKVFYLQAYRSNHGIRLLRKMGVEVTKYSDFVHYADDVYLHTQKQSAD